MNHNEPGNTKPRTAIITGATSGIGTAIADTLYQEGYHVVLTGRSLSKGEALAKRLGVRAKFVAADLTHAASAGTIVDETLAFSGRLDVLVNNAGADYIGDILTTPMKDVRDVFETNTISAFAMLQAAGMAMAAKGGGCIINITSRLASVGVPSMGTYAASKGALLALTVSAAVELAPHNIRVNAVAPGMTRTPLYEEWLAGLPDPKATARSVAASIPLGRIAETGDIAAAVAFLASDRAAYITGASIPVDGGYTAA